MEVCYMSKRKEKEQQLLSFLSDEERKTYEEFEAKLKAKRDVAIKRQKAEMAFWKKVDERENEVYEYIMKKRNARNSNQFLQPAVKNPIEKTDENISTF